MNLIVAKFCCCFVKYKNTLALTRDKTGTHSAGWMGDQTGVHPCIMNNQLQPSSDWVSDDLLLPEKLQGRKQGTLGVWLQENSVRKVILGWCKITSQDTDDDLFQNTRPETRLTTRIEVAWYRKLNSDASVLCSMLSDSWGWFSIGVVPSTSCMLVLCLSSTGPVTNPLLRSGVVKPLVCCIAKGGPLEGGKHLERERLQL